MRHGGRRRAADDADDLAETTADYDVDTLRIDLAQAGSLWSRAEDFWNVVGWAFNCSVLYPRRWTRWQLWLEFMCDVLEDDWAERVRRVEEMDSKSARSSKLLRTSLIMKYIEGTSGISGQHRKILRAIFANGSSPSVHEFREVFHKETKELDKKSDTPKKREADVNIEEEIYGDYLANSDEGNEEESPKPAEERPTRAKRTRTAAAATAAANTETRMHPSYKESEATQSAQAALDLGDVPAFALRQRLLQLLSTVSDSLPNEFMHLDDLYHLFVEFMRHLPLASFQLMVSSPIISGFSAAARPTLCELLLYRLLESDAPSSSEPYLTQDKLEECFLPYAANAANAVDNTKVSILLETLLRSMATNGMLHIRPSLKEAVEYGIEARGEKAFSDTKKSHMKQQEEDVGVLWLVESAERITYMMDEIFTSEK